MHNIKEIRKDFGAFSKALKKRSIDIDLNKLKKLDLQNRELIQKKENLEKEKKDISKTKDKSLFNKSKELSLSIEKIAEQHKKIQSYCKKKKIEYMCSAWDLTSLKQLISLGMRHIKIPSACNNNIELLTYLFKKF